MAQAIAHEKTTDGNGNTITVVESILRSWAESKEPTLQKAFIEYAFGKVPDKLETTGLENKPTLILHWPHEMPGWQPPADKGANYRSGRVFPRSLPASASNGENGESEPESPPTLLS